MSTTSGSRVYLEIDNKIIGKANNFEIDPSLVLDTSESLGKLGPDELMYVDRPPVGVSFTIERRPYEGMVAQGLWPDVSDDLSVHNFQGKTVVARDRVTGATLHKISGFKPTRKPIGFVKGQKSMYRIEGQALLEVERDT